MVVCKDDARRYVAEREAAGAVVREFIVRERADDGAMMHLAGHSREPFAYEDARRGRADYAELASDLARRARFRIEGIELRRTSIHPEEDAGIFDFRFSIFDRGSKCE